MQTKMLVCIAFSLVILMFIAVLTNKHQKVIQSPEEEVVCTIVKFDGCEYIENVIYANNKSTILTHKGNCSNSIHLKTEK